MIDTNDKTIWIDSNDRNDDDDDDEDRAKDRSSPCINDDHALSMYKT